MMKAIILTKGKIAGVDDEDFEQVNKFKWFARFSHGNWYVKRNTYVNGKRTVRSLHQFLMPEVARIDHADGDGLNNSRLNLRAATNSQNMANRKPNKNSASPFKGVGWYSRNKKWGGWHSNKPQANLSGVV